MQPLVNMFACQGSIAVREMLISNLNAWRADPYAQGEKDAAAQYILNGYDQKSRRLSLVDLHLSHLPSSIGFLTELRVLYLAFNNLTELPDEIISLTALRVLDLSVNSFKGKPTQLLQLPRLRVINLSGNSLSPLPKEED